MVQQRALADYVTAYSREGAAERFATLPVPPELTLAWKPLALPLSEPEVTALQDSVAVLLVTVADTAIGLSEQIFLDAMSALDEVPSVFMLVDELEDEDRDRLVSYTRGVLHRRAFRGALSYGGRSELSALLGSIAADVSKLRARRDERHGGRERARQADAETADAERERAEQERKEERRRRCDAIIRRARAVESEVDASRVRALERINEVSLRGYLERELDGRLAAHEPHAWVRLVNPTVNKFLTNWHATQLRSFLLDVSRHTNVDVTLRRDEAGAIGISAQARPFDPHTALKGSFRVAGTALGTKAIIAALIPPLAPFAIPLAIAGAAYAAWDIIRDERAVRRRQLMSDIAPQIVDACHTTTLRAQNDLRETAALVKRAVVKRAAEDVKAVRSEQ
jgi:hypothetical protein